MSENTNEKVMVAEEKPSTEVVTRAARRRYTAEYKLRILQEVEACKETGGIGALLRREGLRSARKRSVYIPDQQHKWDGPLGSWS